MSASLMLLFELLYMKRLQCTGWNSAAVMTSVSSSMFAGLMSTMSWNVFNYCTDRNCIQGHSLKLRSLMSRFHRLIRRSSAETYVSWSELTEIEWMWYACAFAYTFRGTAAMMLSCTDMRGSRRFCWTIGAGSDLWPSRRLLSDTTRNDFSNTFHSLIVLSEDRRYGHMGYGGDA